MKRCNRCGVTKPLDHFTKRRKGRSAGKYLKQCKQCNNKQQKVRNAEAKDRELKGRDLELYENRKFTEMMAAWQVPR